MIRWLVATVLTVAVVLAGVATAAGDDDGPPASRRTPPSSSAPSPSGTPEALTVPAVPAAPAAPRTPVARACYRMTFDQALAPVTQVPASSCERAHTARTLFVGRLGDLVEGRVGAVDSPRVQRAVAQECPRRFADFLGGPEQARRLSLFRPVWFTPTLGEGRQGQDWYRCDLIALAGEGDLAPLAGRLEGILGRLGWKERYGLCATASPGTPSFRRVACGRPHSWRALTTVSFTARAYPGEETVRSRGDEPCTEAARAVAEDPLDFEWGFEWPTAGQWTDGLRYGVCWAPDS